MASVEIVHGDCVEVMRGMEPERFDMVFADPPYNLGVYQVLYRPDGSEYAGVREAWDKFDSFEAYDRFTEAWLTEVRRVMKPTATIWVMGSYHNIYRVGKMMQDMGFWLLNEIVWFKPNAQPNWLGVRFAASHETLIWAQKRRGEKYTFHYHLMKQMNGGKQMRSVWMLPMCQGRERLRDAAGKALHPTQKPEALLERVILSCTNEGDWILDPFCGTGTTLAVARRLGRNAVGIEKELRYVEAVRGRIDGVAAPLLPLG